MHLLRRPRCVVGEDHAGNRVGVGRQLWFGLDPVQGDASRRRDTGTEAHAVNPQGARDQVFQLRQVRCRAVDLAPWPGVDGEARAQFDSRHHPDRPVARLELGQETIGHVEVSVHHGNDVDTHPQRRCRRRLHRGLLDFLDRPAQ